jgi:hypothetical protein
MDWCETMIAAELKLTPIVGQKRAFKLSCFAGGYEPWFSISHSNRNLTDADVDHLVAWLLERKDHKDFTW